MIEKNLRKRLRPIVKRRQLLFLLKKLVFWWLIISFMGVGLVIVNSLFDFNTRSVFWLLCILISFITAVVWYQSSHFEPDYKAIARNIEQLNPELKAALLAAIEQVPSEPDGQFGYLQERVIGEALAHAKQHDWLQSVPQKTIVWAVFSQVAAAIFFVLIVSQLLPSTSFVPQDNIITTLRNERYVISVSPEDTMVEAGTTVPITARFEQKVPSQVSLFIGSSPENKQEIILDKVLNDPLFGGTISRIESDMYYHIEYDGRHTRDYKISVFEYPFLERADANIVYPSYTGLPQKYLKDTRQFNVIEGSDINMTFILNKAVESATLIDRDGSSLELTIDANQPNIYNTSLKLMENQRYELMLVDAEGRTNKIPPRFIIDVLKNLPAEIRITFPNRDIEASAIEEVTLEANARDDYGLNAVGVGYMLGGLEMREISLGQSLPANEENFVEYLLDLESIKAEPNQLLTYYFWAEDVASSGNVRRTTSDLFFTEVRPFEEIFRESQSFQDNQQQQRDQQDQQEEQEQQEQQEGEQQERAEELIELQKQIISATWNIKRRIDQAGSAEEQLENIDLVRQSQQDALDQALSEGQQ